MKQRKGDDDCSVCGCLRSGQYILVDTQSFHAWRFVCDDCIKLIKKL